MESYNTNTANEFNSYLEQIDELSSNPESTLIDSEEITGTSTMSNQLDFIMTGKQLLDMGLSDVPYLIEGLFPKVSVGVFAGSSDVGKSTWLRQLACSISMGKDEFLGFKINAEHKSVIYVSTEDAEDATAVSLKKQFPEISSDDLEGLMFIFETDNLISKLEQTLKVKPADCIIIDAFTDLYGGEMNANNKIRNFIESYYDIAKKHKCFLIFLHHTGKRTEDFLPSKNNLIGSQGFEAKTRIAIELRKDLSNPTLRHMCIVKGNYLAEDAKSNSYVLEFGENLNYTNTGNRAPFTSLVKPKSDSLDRAKAIELAIKFKQEGHGVRDIAQKLNEDGLNYGKSTIAEWVKDCPVVQNTQEALDSGQDSLGEISSDEDCPDVQDSIEELDSGQDYDKDSDTHDFTEESDH